MIQIDIKKLIIVQSIVRVWLAKRYFQRNVTKQKERQNLIKELFQSEICYIQQLEIIVKFMKTLISSSFAKKVSILFCNAEELLKFHFKFCDMLADCITNYWINPLSKPFIEILFTKESFQLYSKYVMNFETANLTLNELNSKPKFIKLTDEIYRQIKTTCNIEFLHLPSWIIAPVQRIPKYCLLLKAILKATDSIHKDYESLSVVSNQMEIFSQELNNKLISNREHRKRSFTLEKSISKEKRSLIRSASSINPVQLDFIQASSKLKEESKKRLSISRFMKQTFSSPSKVKFKDDVQSSELKMSDFRIHRASFSTSSSRVISSCSAPVSPSNSRKSSFSNFKNDFEVKR